MQAKTLFLTHIGTGKTGSTSIQRFLKDNRLKHRQLGCIILGYIVRLQSKKLLYPWQSEDEERVFEFQLLDDNTAYQQLEEVLCQLLQLLVFLHALSGVLKVFMTDPRYTENSFVL